MGEWYYMYYIYKYILKRESISDPMVCRSPQNTKHKSRVKTFKPFYYTTVMDRYKTASYNI